MPHHLIGSASPARSRRCGIAAPTATASTSTGRSRFGHTRLSIIDVAGGAQPLANEDGTVQLVFNGEIWNFVELRDRARARGPPLPHALRHRGDRPRLRGMGRRASSSTSTACSRSASGTRRRERLLLARDRVGKKPLYIAHTAARRRVRLGRALGAPRDRHTTALRRDAVAEYLFQRYVGSPRSLFDGHRPAPAGLYATYDRTTVRAAPVLAARAPARSGRSTRRISAGCCASRCAHG